MREGKRPRASQPVGLLLDTCVWLDLAGNYTNEPLLAALESLCSRDVIDLIVPQRVLDEFARNKERVIKESKAGLTSPGFNLVPATSPLESARRRVTMASSFAFAWTLIAVMARCMAGSAT